LDFILFKFIFTYFNFISFYFFLIIFFFFVQKILKIYFLIITDGDTDGHNSLVYSREFETIYFICHNNTVTSPTELFRRYFIEGWNKITINATTNHRRNNLVSVLKRVIFFLHVFFIYKIIGVFFLLTKITLPTNGFRL